MPATCVVEPGPLPYARPERRRLLRLLPLLVLAAAWPTTQILFVVFDPSASWVQGATQVHARFVMYAHRTGLLIGGSASRFDWGPGGTVYNVSLTNVVPRGELKLRTDIFRAKPYWSYKEDTPVHRTSYWHTPDGEVRALGASVAWHRRREPYRHPVNGVTARLARDEVHVVVPRWLLALASLSSGALLSRRFRRWRRNRSGQSLSQSLGPPPPGGTLTRVTLLVPFLAGLAAAASGCQLLLIPALAVSDVHAKATAPKQAMDFRVVDGETSRPVAGATVDVSNDFDWGTPYRARGQTGADGWVRVPGVILHPPPTATAYAPGYMRSPAPRRPEAGVETELVIYREPRAVTGLIVPAGYRGVLLVDVTSADPVPEFIPGRRVFWTRAAADPKVPTRLVPPPPQLNGGGRSVQTAEAACFDDGTTLPVAAGAARRPGVALWWLGTGRSFPMVRLLFVGTYEEARRAAADLSADASVTLNAVWEKSLKVKEKGHL